MDRKHPFLKASHQPMPTKKRMTSKRAGPTHGARKKASERLAEDRERMIKKEIDRLKPLKAPHEGIVRAVSSKAAKRPPSCKEIVSFKDMVHVYCEVCLGYRSRHIVQIYLHARLTEMLEEKRQQARKDAIQIIRELSAPSKRELMRHELRIKMRRIEREDLERLAGVIFRGIQLEIIELARAGRPVKDEALRRPRYEVRLIHIGEGEARPCFVLINRRNGAFKVVGLSKEPTFRRRKRRGTLRSPAPEYINHPSSYRDP